MQPEDVSVVVLAAGLGSRFGVGPKLLAGLDGRPVLQHVLDAVAEVHPRETIVVLGHFAAEIEADIAWRTERRILNPDPERGLSSSVRLGLEAVTTDAAMIVLGDQPRVSVDMMRTLLGAHPAPIVVPRYADGRARNPLLIRRSAWPLIDRLEGDRGFGPLLAHTSDWVREVAVNGSNRDVDEPADLDRL